MKNNIFLNGWRPISVLLFLFILWEMVVRFSDIPAWLLPAPSSIFLEGMADFARFKVHLYSTIKLSLFGFAVGSSVGFLTAVLLHLIPKLRDSFYPLLIISQNIPIIVLAPLLVIWFGFGLLPKVIVITLVCFFPITVAIMDGFKQVSPELKLYFQMSGSSKWQTFYMLELPHSLPSLFSGLKISATYSVMGAVISEWLGAQNGIGVYMTLASSSFRTDRVFWSILVIILLSLLYVSFILLIEKKWITWQTDKGMDT